MGWAFCPAGVAFYIRSCEFNFIIRKNRGSCTECQRSRLSRAGKMRAVKGFYKD